MISDTDVQDSLLENTVVIGQMLNQRKPKPAGKMLKQYIDQIKAQTNKIIPWSLAKMLIDDAHYLLKNL